MEDGIQSTVMNQFSEAKLDLSQPKELIFLSMELKFGLVKKERLKTRTRKLLKLEHLVQLNLLNLRTHQ
jgi:hypothetical protein